MYQKESDEREKKTYLTNDNNKKKTETESSLRKDKNKGAKIIRKKILLQ